MAVNIQNTYKNGQKIIRLAGELFIMSKLKTLKYIHLIKTMQHHHLQPNGDFDNSLNHLRLVKDANSYIF